MGLRTDGLSDGIKLDFPVLAESEKDTALEKLKPENGLMNVKSNPTPQLNYAKLTPPTAASILRFLLFVYLLRIFFCWEIASLLLPHPHLHPTS